MCGKEYPVKNIQVPTSKIIHDEKKHENITVILPFKNDFRFVLGMQSLLAFRNLLFILKIKSNTKIHAEIAKKRCIPNYYTF